MRRKLKKRPRQRRLAAILSLMLTIAAPAVPAWADTGAQTFSNGQANMLTDNITTVAGPGLFVSNATTSAAMSDLSITVSGSGSGAYTNRGTITLTNVPVSTADGYGVIAVNYGTLRMTGGSINVSGIGNYGAGAAIGGKIYLTNTLVRTTGDSDFGLYAFASDATSAEMTGGSITTNGVQAHGAYASAVGHISLNNVNIVVNGATSYGVAADNDGKLEMTGGTITTSDTATNSYGAFVNNAASSVTLTNVSIYTNDASSYALAAVDGRLIASLNGQDITGVGGLIAVVGGTVDLTASGGSRLYGATQVGGGTANLTLTSGAVWTMPADSTLTNLTLNGGSVTFSSPTAAGGPYKRMELLGNLAASGGSGGTINASANINVGLSDYLYIRGLATGNHHFSISLLGGYPTDLYNTVKVVDLDDETLSHTAIFSGGSDVRAYRYGVAQGSALSSAYNYNNSSISNSSDYYLYNTFTPSTASQAAMGLSAGTSVVWYGEMNEIKKRMGDLRMGKQSPDDFWVRTYADKYNVRPGGGYDYSQTMRGFELGKDNPQHIVGGKKYTGFVLGTGRADNTFFGGGSGTTHSTYAGAYVSWLRDDGSYVDIIGKYNWFNHRFATPLLGGGSDSGHYNNRGLGLSAEIGKRFEKGKGFYIEPAAELSALWADKAAYTTASGLAIETPAMRSLQLRLGVTAGGKWTNPDGATRQAYVKAGWVNEYKGDSSTRVDSASFDSRLQGHQWVTGLGYIEDSGRYQLYLDVEKSWGCSVSKAWGVNLGYRWKY